MSLIRDRDSFIQKFWYSFLDLYHSLPCLWDVNCVDYFRKRPRRTAYNILLEKFKEIDENATVEDVKRKIDVFRTGFRREERKIKEIRSREPDTDYEPTLWYYNHLAFLSGIVITGHEKAKRAGGKSKKLKPSSFEFKSKDDEGRESKPKKLRQNNFTIVKKCCVNLVKKHGRSVTLFDDLAFRELIDLIPLTQSERQTLTSQYIQTLLDDDQLADDTDMETMDKTTDDVAAADDDDDDTPLYAIKGEVEPIPCTCGKDTDESMPRHTVECPASSQQTYWNFFEVSLDSATCQICNKTLTWTNIATLKEHLQSSHPSVDFIDDDDEFQKGPPSEDESTNDFGMEEVYLDEAILETEQTASAAKRRRKRAKAALNITGPITRENIAASLQRFKSLDSFGQYVASLMKLIPKDKCIKFQIQIVERLLQEQAAAG